VAPGAKDQWDLALVQTERKITEMVAQKDGESWREFLAKRREREAAIAAAV